MALTGTSLNGVSALGPGTTILFDTPKANVALHATTTGAPSSFEVDLEVTLDGINFTSVAADPNNAIVTMGAGMVAIGARANLVSLSGGSSPTVTAVIAAA